MKVITFFCKYCIYFALLNQKMMYDVYMCVCVFVFITFITLLVFCNFCGANP